MPDLRTGEAPVDRGRGASAMLARLRVPLGFGCGIVALWLARPTGASVAAGGAIACAGEALRVWAAGHLRKAQEVTASGPYRWLAHPLYVGSSVMGVGLAIASASLPVVVLVAAYLAATLVAAARTEEAALTEKFGASYDRYRRAGEGDRRRGFGLSQAIANREHRAVLGLAGALALMVLKALMTR